MQRKEAIGLLDLPLKELFARADKIRSGCGLKSVELCSIMNAKSGSCLEDCKFCAQSARHKTTAAAYPLKSKKDMLSAAHRAKEIGAERFDLVTSGNRLTQEEINLIREAIQKIREELKIKICASLGNLSRENLILLKEAGLSRYHHNIETSENFFPKIVSTHTFQERLATILAAKQAGLEVCSGGIIGMGEDWQDRIDMALTLKELNVDSVPLNLLVPIKGTPFENKERLSPDEALKTIAIFRIILEDKIIKVAAGRESILGDAQAMAFMAGANGMLIGGYLTIPGQEVERDKKLVKEAEALWSNQG